MQTDYSSPYWSRIYPGSRYVPPTPEPAPETPAVNYLDLLSSAAASGAELNLSDLTGFNAAIDQ